MSGNTQFLLSAAYQSSPEVRRQGTGFPRKLLLVRNARSFCYRLPIKVLRGSAGKGTAFRSNISI